MQGREDRSFWKEHSGRNILEGIETSCLVGGSDSGLHVNGPSSKIKIVKPLTKEAISKGNKGGRNWGADNGAKLYQIETIESRK